MKLLTYVVATFSADSSTNTTPPEFANPTGVRRRRPAHNRTRDLRRHRPLPQPRARTRMVRPQHRHRLRRRPCPRPRRPHAQHLTRPPVTVLCDGPEAPSLGERGNQELPALALGG